jgi:hypothetical protein
MLSSRTTLSRLRGGELDSPPGSAPPSTSWRRPILHKPRLRAYSRSDHFPSLSSVLSDPIPDEGAHPEDDLYHCVNKDPVSSPKSSAKLTRQPAPVHAIGTPKPTLLFAIASDDVAEVRRVLESGDAQPNDQVGPQSALAFTLTNDKLTNKLDIVKSLLAFGADTSVLRSAEQNPPRRPSPTSDESGTSSPERPPCTMLEGMDPATRYVLAYSEEFTR